MSRNKSLQLRGVLTLGAAALALCVGVAPGIAAGHEGRAGGGAAARGAGGGAGDVGRINERFGSMRVETLSPAGFVTPASGGTSRPSASTQALSATIRAPTASTQPPAAAAGGVREPSASTEPPADAMRGPVRDPVLPSPNTRGALPAATKPAQDSALPDGGRSPEPPVPPPPSVAVRTPSATTQPPPAPAMRGLVRDPVLPSPDTRGALPDAIRPVQDPASPGGKKSPEPPVPPPQQR